MNRLTPAAEKLLAGYLPAYREVALSAVREGKAFCPACHSTGYSNCGYFDECDAFVMRDGRAANEEGRSDVS